MGLFVALPILGGCMETRGTGADGAVDVPSAGGGYNRVNIRCNAVEPVQVTTRVDGSSVTVPTAAGTVSVNLGGVQLSRQAAEQVGAPFYLIQALMNDLCVSRLLRPTDPTIDVQRRELILVTNNYVASLGRARSSEDVSAAASQATQAARQVVPAANADAAAGQAAQAAQTARLTAPAAGAETPVARSAMTPLVPGTVTVSETRLLTLRSGRTERLEIGQRESGDTVELCVPDQVPGLPQGGRIETRLAGTTQPESQSAPLVASGRGCTVLGEPGQLFTGRIDNGGPATILVSRSISNGLIGGLDALRTAATGTELRVPLSFSVVRSGPRAP